MHSRDHINAIFSRIPWWKRLLVCEVLRRRQARIARAYSKVAVHAYNVLGDYDLYAQLRRLNDRQWVHLYRR